MLTLTLCVGCSADESTGLAASTMEPDFSPDPSPDAEPAVAPDPNPAPSPDAEPDPDPEPDPGPNADGPDNYDFASPGSHVTSLAVVMDPSVGVDLNDDSLPDNAMASLLMDLNSIVGGTDLNATLEAALTDGSLLLGTKWPTLDGGIADSEDVEVHFFALLQDGEDFVATRDSFVEGSSQPAVSFMDAAIREGVLVAGPSRFDLTLPFGDLQITTSIERAYLAGDLFTDNDGVAMTEGSMAGAVPLQSIVSALNTYLASDACSCLELSAPLMDLSEGIGPSSCSQDYATQTCAALDQQVCATIAEACMLVVSVLDGQTDIDLDRDGEPDAVSLFMRLTMEGASIPGPESPER